MGLKPDAPKAPDPTKTANTQLGYNTNAAQSTINMNSLDKNGPFGSATFTHDANGNVTGQNVSLSDALQGGANSTQNAYTNLAGNLPTDPINWDNTTANTIAQNNINAYTQSVQPLRDQTQKNLDVTLAERGIPIGSEVYGDAQGNLDRNNAIADTNAVAQAWNAVPGMQGQLINNQTAQYNQPYQAAANSLGLLQGLNSLATPAAQGSASVAAPNYAGLVQNQFDNQTQQYNSQMNGLGSLAGAGLGLLTAPLTGPAGLSSSLLGMGAQSLLN